MKHYSILTTVFIALIAISCSVLTPSGLQYSQQPRLGYVTYIPQATVFQTLGEHFALANYKYQVPGPSVVVALQTGDGDSPMYDGRMVGGDFVMIDTYTYTTYPDENGNTYVKTVPLMLYKEVYLKQQTANQQQ